MNYSIRTIFGSNKAGEMKLDLLVASTLSLAVLIITHIRPGAIAFLTPLLRQILLISLTTPILFISGRTFFIGSYQALKARRINMSILIATAGLSTYTASIALWYFGGDVSYFEATALLITSVLFANWIELRAQQGTSNALLALFKLVPAQTNIIKSGTIITVSTKDLTPGDIVVVYPGQKIPTDGKVVSGQTSIDESLITGESQPVHKKTADMVIGGSINQLGTIEFEVTQPANQTFLSQIITLVEKAQTIKSPGQRLADAVAAWLVLLTLGSGLVSFALWFWWMKVSFIEALSFGVSAIVVACPDSLGLATPAAIAVGSGIGAQHHILIKSAEAFEKAAQIKAIFFDKTGTLTKGTSNIATIIAEDKKKLLYFAASAQQRSNHPFAQATLTEAKKEGINPSHNVSNITVIGGVGIRAVVDDQEVIVGTPHLLESLNITISNTICEAIKTEENTANSISLVSVNKVILGVLCATDTIRSEAKKAIEELRKLGILTIMLTGDSEHAARNIAQSTGIQTFFARVLPEDKLSHIKAYQDKGMRVAMVGDGINDAPALAQSDVGIAIGAGTDVARETASFILITSDLQDIARAIKLARATVKKIRQNLVWAISYNLITIPIAGGVLYPLLGWKVSPAIAALLTSISSVIVALNALHLKKVNLT